MAVIRTRLFDPDLFHLCDVCCDALDGLAVPYCGDLSPAAHPVCAIRARVAAEDEPLLALEWPWLYRPAAAN